MGRVVSRIRLATTKAGREGKRKSEKVTYGNRLEGKVTADHLKARRAFHSVWSSQFYDLKSRIKNAFESKNRIDKPEYHI